MFPGGYKSLGHNFGHWNCFLGREIAVGGQGLSREIFVSSKLLHWLRLRLFLLCKVLRFDTTYKQRNQRTWRREWERFFWGLRWFKYIQYVKRMKGLLCNPSWNRTSEFWCLKTLDTSISIACILVLILALSWVTCSKKLYNIPQITLYFCPCLVSSWRHLPISWCYFLPFQFPIINLHKPSIDGISTTVVGFGDDPFIRWKPHFHIHFHVPLDLGELKLGWIGPPGCFLSSL